MPPRNRLSACPRSARQPNRQQKRRRKPAPSSCACCFDSSGGRPATRDGRSSRPSPGALMALNTFWAPALSPEASRAWPRRIWPLTGSFMGLLTPAWMSARPSLPLPWLTRSSPTLTSASPCGWAWAAAVFFARLAALAAACALGQIEQAGGALVGQHLGGDALLGHRLGFGGIAELQRQLRQQQILVLGGDVAGQHAHAIDVQRIASPTGRANVPPAATRCFQCSGLPERPTRSPATGAGWLHRHSRKRSAPAAPARYRWSCSSSP